MAVNKLNAETGVPGNKSQVIAFWNEKHNVGVLSSTDKEFVEELKTWAKANGYRVEEVG